VGAFKGDSNNQKNDKNTPPPSNPGTGAAPPQP
jgi:hypothetical protein